ncbi:MAG: DNA-directed RNA polymerase subunit P [Candidatus Micrarchaeia archaeon]
MYICGNCGKEIEEITNFVRCPYCAWRILYKPSLPVARVVKTD